MRLLEDFDDNGFIYERGSIILKGYFFQETHQTDTHVHFQDYQSDVTFKTYVLIFCLHTATQPSLQGPCKPSLNSFESIG